MKISQSYFLASPERAILLGKLKTITVESGFVILTPLFLAIANVSAEDTTGNLTVASADLSVDEVLSLDDNIYHINN